MTRRRSVVLLSLCLTACNADIPIGLDDEAISGGTNDVLLDTSTGIVLDDVAEWSRDASVRVLAPGGSCSGTLISPRIVITNSHCVRGCPLGAPLCGTAANFAAGLAATTVAFSPIDAGGSVPPGTPPVVNVQVIDVVTHPDSHVLPFDGGNRCLVYPSCVEIHPECPNKDRDIAVLVLAERVDHRVMGGGTRDYSAIPAHVRLDDRVCAIVLPVPPFVIEEPDPDCWDGYQIDHVGYGGLVTGSGTPVPAIRQVVTQGIGLGNTTLCSWSSSLTLYNSLGGAGDSGGGYFSQRPMDGPMELLAVHTGQYGNDHAVRLTHDAIQNFLARFLGPHDAGFVGTDYVLSHAAPGTPTVWTGDTDCPPASEPGPRGAWHDALGRDAATMDPDGDGMIGPHDDCWGIPNIEQCTPGTTCSDSGRISPPSGLRATCTTTGVTQTYGCMSETSSAPGAMEVGLDPDNDGIPWGCDNCPRNWNRDQTDLDLNGTGDVCDGADRDGDRVRGIDNCPFHRNTDQSNCNIDSEAQSTIDPAGHIVPPLYDPVHGLFGVGDACDSTPCGDTEMATRTLGSRVVTDRIEVAPHDIVEGNYQTGFRICPCSVATDNSTRTRSQCQGAVHVIVEDPISHVRRPVLDGSGGCMINDVTTFDQTTEQPTWRFATLALRSGPSAPTQTFLLDYRFRDDAGFDPTFDTNLALGGDALRWAGSFPTAYPEGGPSFVDVTMEPFGTILWTHTPSAGPTAIPLVSTQRQLASHYWSGRIDAPIQVVTPVLDASIALPAPIDASVCPACAASFPRTFVVGSAAGLSGAPAHLAFEGGSVLAETVAPSFALFGQPGVDRWIVSSDHPAFETIEGLRAIGLSHGGTTLTALLAQHDGALVDELITGCPKNRCNAIAVPRDTLFPTSPPPPREQFAAAMSGHERSVWIAGGIDATGTALGDIWEQDLAQRTWRQFEVSRSGELGAIRALAWGSATRALYVLDEVLERHARIIRLVRVEPSGDSIVVERRFPARNDARYELVIDPSGDAWVVAAQTEHGHARHTYSVLRLALRDHPTRDSRWVARSYSEHVGDVLVGAVSASDHGLSLLVVGSRGAVPVGIPSTSIGRGRPDDDCAGADRWF